MPAATTFSHGLCGERTDLSELLHVPVPFHEAENGADGWRTGRRQRHVQGAKGHRAFQAAHDFLLEKTGKSAIL